MNKFNHDTRCVGTSAFGIRMPIIKELLPHQIKEACIKEKRKVMAERLRYNSQTPRQSYLSKASFIHNLKTVMER